jgi:hypothetical protein
MKFKPRVCPKARKNWRLKKIFRTVRENKDDFFICRSQLCIYSRPMDEVIRVLFQRKKENEISIKFVSCTRIEPVQGFLIYLSNTLRN